MKTIAVRVRWAVLALILFYGSGLAAERDSKADVVAIGARLVAMYARTPHKAGDPDGQFIEDVVIPAVHDVVASGAPLTSDQHREVLNFIVASDSLASEEISDIAAGLYLSQKVGLCAAVANLSQSTRTIVVDRIKSGLAATGKPVPRVVCKSNKS